MLPPMCEDNELTYKPYHTPFKSPLNRRPIVFICVDTAWAKMAPSRRFSRGCPTCGLNQITVFYDNMRAFTPISPASCQIKNGRYSSPVSPPASVNLARVWKSRSRSLPHCHCGSPYAHASPCMFRAFFYWENLVIACIVILTGRVAEHVLCTPMGLSFNVRRSTKLIFEYRIQYDF